MCIRDRSQCTQPRIDHLAEWSEKIGQRRLNLAGDLDEFRIERQARLFRRLWQSRCLFWHGLVQSDEGALLGAALVCRCLPLSFGEQIVDALYCLDSGRAKIDSRDCVA